MAFIRKVNKNSSATAVQIAYKAGGHIVKIEHIGIAHTNEDLQILLESAHQRLLANQLRLFSEDQSSLQVSMKRSSSDFLPNFQLFSVIMKIEYLLNKIYTIQGDSNMNHRTSFKKHTKMMQRKLFSFFALLLILSLIVQLLPIGNVAAQSISSSTAPTSSKISASISTEIQEPSPAFTETLEPTHAFTETPELTSTFTETPVATIATSETPKPTFTSTQITESTPSPSGSTKPAIPKLIAPINGVVVKITIPKLSIGSVAGANQYQFQVNSKNDFTSPLVNITQTSTTCTLVNKQALPFGLVYWRARSIDIAHNASDWSTIQSFTINILNSPANKSYSTNQKPTFSWAIAASGTLNYEIQVDTSKDFNVTPLTLDKKQITSTSFTPSNPFPYGIYYWRVRINPSIGNANNWTPVWSFIITPPLPKAPVLSTPAAGFLFYDNSPSLVWKTVTGTFSNYEVQISSSTGFLVITQDAIIRKGTTAYNAKALQNGKYYWRVRAVNYLGVSGPWSATNYFSINYISPKHNIRFGITTPNGITGYPINTLGISSYLDWGMTLKPANTPGITYIQTVHLRDSHCNYMLDSASPALAKTLLANITLVAKANLGSYWLIGNEPDTAFKDPNGNCQDNLTPTQYATAYKIVYTAIKSADSTAKIGIGTIVEPTALRMKYLDLVYAAYKAHYGVYPPSDFWSIHSFILPENSSWGTGIPPGMSAYSSLAVNYSIPQTIDITIFEQRLLAFRKWMAAKGEQNKPLWITEYGSLFPSDPSGGLVTIPITSTRSFMLATFNYLQTATDSKYGDPKDNYHLVQKWFWYSLNDSQAKMGGGLYDPNNNKARTILGDAFINYVVTH
jgi:hypothetical protein